MKTFGSRAGILAGLLALTVAVSCSRPAATAEKAGRTVLYNGIVLPEVWPPRYPVPTERKAMPLPYIDEKPNPILINVGRQLFVDDFLIEETDLERVCHHANLYAGSPVIDGLTYSDGVWYDEQAGKFKMWYNAPRLPDYKKGDESLNAYAESDDGYHWYKPELDVFPGTNVTNNLSGEQVVWLDKQEKDPAKRYKSVAGYTVGYGGSFILQYSADGIHWGPPAAASGVIQDRSTCFYNPFTKKWVMSIRVCALNPPTRSRAYVEDESLERLLLRTHSIQDELGYVIRDSVENYYIKDKDIAFWFTADDQDTRHINPVVADLSPCAPAIYNFDAIGYESIMLGEYAMYRGPEADVMRKLKEWKLNEVGLGYSRDGFHFYRPDHTPFMASAYGDTTAWNAANMQVTAGNALIVGDSLFFYVGAHKMRLGMGKGIESTGLGTLRRDGFVSMDGSGTLLTSPVSFDGKYFFVNAAAKELAVELIGADGAPVKGFTKEDCVAMKETDSTKYRITWGKHKDLSRFRNQPVRFKFYLTEGSLYAFWVSPWETGESRGFTGGGGPGLHPSGVDLPVRP